MIGVARCAKRRETFDSANGGRREWWTRAESMGREAGRFARYDEGVCLMFIIRDGGKLEVEG